MGRGFESPRRLQLRSEPPPRGVPLPHPPPGACRTSAAPGVEADADGCATGTLRQGRHRAPPARARHDRAPPGPVVGRRPAVDHAIRRRSWPAGLREVAMADAPWTPDRGWASSRGGRPARPAPPRAPSGSRSARGVVLTSPRSAPPIRRALPAPWSRVVGRGAISGFEAGGAATGRGLRCPGPRPPSIGAGGLAAEHRDHLPGLLALALREIGRVVLQAIVLTDRQAELEALTAGLALELVDGHRPHLLLDRSPSHTTRRPGHVRQSPIGARAGMAPAGASERPRYRSGRAGRLPTGRPGRGIERRPCRPRGGTDVGLRTGSAAASDGGRRARPGPGR